MATRLFHASEQDGIARFEPRLPARADLDRGTGLVWAIDEARLPNYLTPRDCPRVTYHAAAHTTAEDRARFFSSGTTRHVVAIEHGWFPALLRTTLYLYEFDPAGFRLQDDVAGYYVSEQPQVPISKVVVRNLCEELFRRNVELRVVDNLLDLAREVRQSTLNWSLCRMGNARQQSASL